MDGSPTDRNEAESADDSTTEMSRLETLWRDSWSALFKGLLLSIGFHLLLALPVIFQPSLLDDFELEWEGRFADLEAIGHGTTDFDDREDVDWDRMVDVESNADEPEDEKPDEDDGVEEADDALDEDEEDPQPDEAQDEDDEQPADEEDEDDPVDETEPEAVAEADVPETDDPGPEVADETTEPETTSPDETVEYDEGVPGVEHSGPSNLPDLREYGPGNARVTSLVRIDRLRDTDFEPYVDKLIRAIPDYRIALDGTDFDPVDDLDSFFMATANPEVLQETFLAARHRIDDEELRTTLDSRFDEEIPWETRDERPVRPLVPESVRYRDPRRLMLAEPGLALIGQPEWFDDLIGPVDDDSELGRELADADEGPSVFSLLDGLNRIEETVEDEETLLLASAYGARLPNMSVAGVDVGDLPFFEAAQLAVSDAENPRVEIDLRMRSTEDARHFEQRCPEIRRQAMNSPIVRLMDLAELFDPIECRRDGEYVVVDAQYSGDRVRRWLDRLPALVENTTPPTVQRLPSAPAADDADDRDDDDRDDGERDDADTSEADDREPDAESTPE